jgi:hypothetical protein
MLFLLGLISIGHVCQDGKIFKIFCHGSQDISHFLKVTLIETKDHVLLILFEVDELRNCCLSVVLLECSGVMLVQDHRVIDNRVSTRLY